MRPAVLLCALAACAPAPAVVPFAAPLGRPDVGARLIVAGDTQRTGLIEVWRERNEPERRLVLTAIAEAQPDLVAFTGDLVFDSNDGEPSPAERDADRAWYGKTLGACDADPSVRGVLVLLHHPAWTNSTVAGDEPTVERDVVPPFVAAKKTLALLSGHVHSYERFVRDGKTFVVSGGGGGPRAALDVGPGRRHTDDQFSGPALRDFHFTVYTLGARGLDAEVRGLAKGATTFHAMDRFSLPFP